MPVSDLFHKFDTQIFQVSQTIWCVRRPSYLTCSYLVKTDQGVVLIDAGMDSKGQDMLAGLAYISEPVSSVKALLLTHWHNDHAAGAQYLQQKYQIPVYYHPQETPYLTRQTARQGLRGRVSLGLPEWGPFVLAKGLLGEAIPDAVEANVFANEGDQIFNQFEILHTPGHTPGHLAFYYPAEKALFAGDALAVIGQKIRFMARPVTPDLPQARASILHALDREILLICPGHRKPLHTDVPAQCQQMLLQIQAGEKWPFFG